MVIHPIKKYHGNFEITAKSSCRDQYSNPTAMQSSNTTFKSLLLYKCLSFMMLKFCHE